MSRHLALSFCLLASGVLLGCSGADDGPDLFEVTGTVTYAGKPLEKGAIVLDSKDGATIAVQGAIENGTYTVRAPVGPKIVRINAVRETNEKDQYGEPVTESYIPAKYNADSTTEIVVLGTGENVHDFELEE